jgi:hypothetical protein
MPVTADQTEWTESPSIFAKTSSGLGIVREAIIATSLMAERNTSRGKPFGESNSAQSTVPMLLRMFNIVTWMPGQDVCPATTSAFTGISQARQKREKAILARATGCDGWRAQHRRILGYP